MGSITAVKQFVLFYSHSEAKLMSFIYQPFVYNSKTKVMVSFDDPTSFRAKGSFIKSNGLRGFAMWEAGGDYHDVLLTAIRTSAFWWYMF